MKAFVRNLTYVSTFLFSLTGAAATEPVVLDVRTPEEYEQSHVKGAVNIDVNGASFQREVQKLDKSADYVVYCRSGKRSAQAIKEMKDVGFTSVKNLGSAKDASDTLKRECEGKSKKCL